MLFPRAPKPVLSTKPVAVQVVRHQQKLAGAVDPHVLIVDRTGPPVTPVEQAPALKPD